MRKKEEFESARLMDFEFRQRARATRLLARSCGMDEAALVAEIATRTEQAVIALVADRSGDTEEAVAARYAMCSAEARRQLIAERGDPTPYRLG